MVAQAPLPQSTLVVLLGASEWPKWSSLNSDLADKGVGNAETFARSADAFKTYLIDNKGFNLPENNLLNLFDSEEGQQRQLGLMATFLKERIASAKRTSHALTHLIVYYVGHNDSVDTVYYLTLRSSEEGNKIASSLSSKSLVEIIKENARHLHCFFLVDCCFAGTVGTAFVDSPITGGVSLLCSSDSTSTSMATPNEPHTMFSTALLQVLQHGNREAPEHYSLRLLLKEMQQEIGVKHGENGVMPIIHSPKYSQGSNDIADFPLFPNTARQFDDRGSFQAKNDLAQCYVIESSTEKTLGKNQRLGFAVRKALLNYREGLSAAMGKELDTSPVAINVDQVISSHEGFGNAVQAVCQAEIAVFDVTNYEPVVMLLLGIRSVVRRGITLASVGGDYVIGDPINYPFSIKEVNIISHSKVQGGTRQPSDLIGSKMIEGFTQLRHLPDYLDLPVFDAIRTLPPDRDQRIPREYNEQVLVLCSFSPRYTKNNWKEYLKNHLELYLPKTPKGDPPPILRTLDMKSPRLVSQSLYEAIRLTQMCIIDWTEWRPNVFFELGVRLAAVDIDPICIIETTHRKVIEELVDIKNFATMLEKLQTNLHEDDEPKRLIHAAYQSRRLLEFFDPIEYRVPKEGEQPYEEEDLPPYEKMVNDHRLLLQQNRRSDNEMALPSGFTYRIVSNNIDGNMEVSAFPVHDELIRSADLLSDPETNSAGRSSVLYPQNESLTRKANEGALERRLAAWYYIENRLYAKLQEDQKLREKFIDLGELLARALRGSPEENDKKEAIRIRQRVKELKE